MKRFSILAIVLCTVMSTFALTIDKDKVYSIKNRVEAGNYVQDNLSADNALSWGRVKNDYSYWRFIPVEGQTDRYYIQNVLTERYAQSYTVQDNADIFMGDTQVEYIVKQCGDYFGIACAEGQTNTDFSDGACKGWNRNDGGTVKAYQAKANTNNKSFWTLTEEDYVAPAPKEDEWPLDGKVCTIKNKIENHRLPSFWQDNKWADNRIQCDDLLNSYSYWTFEKATNTDCYYIKNTATGRYVQGYSKSSEVVSLGNAKEEYFVKYFDNENAYGIASTANSPYDCTSGTVGLNLKAEPDEEDCLVQTYAAVAGTNHRSFWLLSEYVAGVSVTVSNVGYTTFVAPFDVDVPSGVEAYTVQVEGNVARLNSVRAIPAGEAVVLKNEGTYTFNKAVSAVSPIKENDLIASYNGVVGNGSVYALANGTHGVGFYKVGEKVVVPLAKGYLQLTSEAKAITFVFDGENETGITSLNAEKADGAIYNLAGQRIQKMRKGINIVNGKKVLL